MTSAEPQTLRIESEGDIVTVRQVVRAWSTRLGFSAVDQSKLTTAASELARNTLVYGRGGSVRIEEVEQAGRTGLRLNFTDRGPGIPDLELALKDGYTTGNGLGLGLGGTRRLMHEFHIRSQLNEGTSVTIAHFRRS